MRIVAISDIHGQYNKLTIPECDLLISAGDYSSCGRAEEVQGFHEWLEKQPAKRIISLQGNHEKGTERHFDLAKSIALAACPRVDFLARGVLEIDGVKIYCSAITPTFFNWAYMLPRNSPEMKAEWDLIPDDTELLITHGPPHMILDKVKGPKANAGCELLKERIGQLKKLRCHIFGHLHANYGMMRIGKITFINAAQLNDNHKLVNKPVEFEFH